MANLTWAPGDKFIWSNTEYIVDADLGGGQRTLRYLQYPNQPQQVVTLDQLNQAYLRSEIIGAVPPSDYSRTQPGASLPTRYSVEVLQDLDPERYAETIRRLLLVERWADLPANERTKRKIAETLKAERPAPEGGMILVAGADGKAHIQRPRSKVGEAESAASIFRWVQKILKAKDPRVLIPNTVKQGGPGGHRLDPEAEKCVTAVLAVCAANLKKYPGLPGYSYKDLLAFIRAEIKKSNTARELHNATLSTESKMRLPELKVPNRRTIESRLIEKNLLFILERLPSRLEALAKSGVMPGPDPLSIGDRVEFDCTWLDVILLDDDLLPLGRASMALGVDKKSGCPYALAVGVNLRPGYELVSAGLLSGILPGPDTQRLFGTENRWLGQGKPAMIVTDNGPEFVNASFEASLITLKIKWMRMPRGAAWFKGTIERLIETLNEGYIHWTPGTTYSNAQARGDYASKKYASVRYSVFVRELYKWFVDDYAASWSRSHGSTARDFMGKVPANSWMEDLALGLPLPLHHSADEVRYCLLPVVQDGRVINREGFIVDYIGYQSYELIALRSDLAPLPREERIVYPRFDYGDRSYLMLAHPLRPGEYLRIPSAMPRYTDTGTPLTHYSHLKNIEILKKQKRAVDEDSLAEIRVARRETIEGEYKRTKRVQGRSKLGRELGVGRGDSPGLVPASPAFPGHPAPAASPFRSQPQAPHSPGATPATATYLQLVKGKVANEATQVVSYMPEASEASDVFNDSGAVVGAVSAVSEADALAAYQARFRGSYALPQVDAEGDTEGDDYGE
jgi:putative transposase